MNFCSQSFTDSSNPKEINFVSESPCTINFKLPINESIYIDFDMAKFYFHPLMNENIFNSRY